MALIDCKECGRSISDKAASCPGCGLELMQRSVKAKNAVVTAGSIPPTLRLVFLAIFAGLCAFYAIFK